MSFQDDDAFWCNKINSIPKDVIPPMIHNRFPDSSDLVFHEDERMFTWIYQTCCMHLSLDYPEAWLVQAVWRYLEKNEM